MGPWTKTQILPFVKVTQSWTQKTASFILTKVQYYSRWSGEDIPGAASAASSGQKHWKGSLVRRVAIYRLLDMRLQELRLTCPVLGKRTASDGGFNQNLQIEIDTGERKHKNHIGAERKNAELVRLGTPGEVIWILVTFRGQRNSLILTWRRWGEGVKRRERESRGR